MGGALHVLWWVYTRSARLEHGPSGALAEDDEEGAGMPYWAVSLRGSLGAEENWSVNPRFAYSIGHDWNQDEFNAIAAAVAAVVIPTPLNDVRSSTALPVSVRVESREDNGTLNGAGESAWSASAGSTAATKPPQTAIVLSLRTATPGASGRGRLYWPGLTAVINANTLRMSQATINGLSAAAVTYLRNIQDAIKATANPVGSAEVVELCVVSPKNGNHKRVTSIQVGDVLDVQRRRRDKLRETYSTTPMY
jgi:hypothetical protein